MRFTTSKASPSPAVQRRKQATRIVRTVSSFGSPFLVASDTSPPSHFVQIIARLNVRVFSPNESMEEENRRIGPELTNAHVRDPSAAAVKAYRRYQNRLRQIDSMGH